MFKDKLYTILTLQPIDYYKLIFVIKFNPDHIIYKAHFPNNPITPGVCIVQIAKELFNFALQKDCTIKKLKNVKFINPILPDDMVVFYIDWQYVDDFYNLKVKVYEIEDTFAKIDMQLSEH